jgi:hypothetical protein
VISPGRDPAIEPLLKRRGLGRRKAELRGDPRVAPGGASIPARQPGGAPAVRPRAAASTCLARSPGSGRKGRITREDVTRPSSSGAGASAPRRRRPAGRRRRPQPAALAEGRLRQVRPGRREAAVAHQEDLRRQPRPQLGDDPARHPVRRGRHHRDGGLPQESARRIKDVKVTPLVFLIKAAVAALKRFPNFNASLDERREPGAQAVLPHRHRGRHARWPGGAGDPRLRPQGPARAGARTGGEISEVKARDKKLGPGRHVGRLLLDQLARRHRRQCFTPIINAPEVAILGVSKSSDEAGLERQRVQPRLMLPLSLSLRPPGHRRRRVRAAGRASVPARQEAALPPEDQAVLARARRHEAAGLLLGVVAPAAQPTPPHALMEGAAPAAPLWINRPSAADGVPSAPARRGTAWRSAARRGARCRFPRRFPRSSRSGRRRCA